MKGIPNILANYTLDVVCPTCNMTHDVKTTDDWIQSNQYNEWWYD